MHPLVHDSSIHSRQDVEAACVTLTDGWIKKMWRTYDGILLGHKKEWSHVDEPTDYHSERSKTVKDKYSITYTWNLKYDTDELIYKTETGTQTYGYQREKGGGINLEFGISKYKLLFIKYNI